MKHILLFVLCIFPSLPMAQTNDIVSMSQKDLLEVLDNIRINYDANSYNSFKEVEKLHFCFKRDLLGSLYYCSKDDPKQYKLDSKRVFDDQIKNRLSLLLDDEYEQSEIDVLLNAKVIDSFPPRDNNYQFNIAMVVWLVVMSSDEALISQLARNYNNGCYTSKVNSLIEKTLAGIGLQPFKGDFIKTHTYDSDKNGDDLAKLLGDIFYYFLLVSEKNKKSNKK